MVLKPDGGDPRKIETQRSNWLTEVYLKNVFVCVVLAVALHRETSRRFLRLVCVKVPSGRNV